MSCLKIDKLMCPLPCQFLQSDIYFIFPREHKSGSTSLFAVIAHHDCLRVLSLVLQCSWDQPKIMLRQLQTNMYQKHWQLSCTRPMRSRESVLETSVMEIIKQSIFQFACKQLFVISRNSLKLATMNNNTKTPAHKDIIVCFRTVIPTNVC